jgi:hypothetical protein
VEGTTLVDVEGVVVVVLVLLGALLPPPPQPTAKTSIAAPPKTATAVRASDLIRLPTLPTVLRTFSSYPLAPLANRSQRDGGAIGINVTTKNREVANVACAHRIPRTDWADR